MLLRLIDEHLTLSNSTGDSQLWHIYCIATLAEAVQQGAEAVGTEVSLHFVDDFIASFLRDCRTCRLPNGECAIADQFRTLFFDDFLPADGEIFCSPIYWYGLSAQTKAFFDRIFCYYAASYPDCDRVLFQSIKMNAIARWQCQLWMNA